MKKGAKLKLTGMISRYISYVSIKYLKYNSYSVLNNALSQSVYASRTPLSTLLLN